MAIDWRTRWGWNWVTPARQQRPCSACVAFAYVGLTEAMARIEHATWCARSEGDLRGQLKQDCPDFGDIVSTVLSGHRRKAPSQQGSAESMTVVAGPERI